MTRTDPVRALRFLINFTFDHAGPTTSGPMMQTELETGGVMEPPCGYVADADARVLRSGTAYTDQVFARTQ
jgi:hypothetical protein